MKRSAVTLFLSLIVVLIGIADIAKAETKNDGSKTAALGVTPAISELILDPGATKTLKVVVTNITDQPLPVRGSASSFVPNEEVSQKDRKIFDASSWFVIHETDFILQPKQSKEVLVSIAPPKNAEPGGHYATVYFQPLQLSTVIKENTSYITSKVGILMLLVVKGDIKQQIKVAELSVPFVKQAGPIEFSLRLQNTGNTHLTPRGYVSIQNIFGKELQRLEVPKHLLLPKTTKTILFKWDNQSRLGYYKAKAFITYGSSHTKISSGYAGVIIFPLLTILVTIFLLGGFSFIFWRTKGRWRRAIRALRQSEKNKQTLPKRKKIIKRRPKITKK